MKKLVSLVLMLALTVCVLSAMAENAGQGQDLRVGELAYLNSDEATRAAMLMQIEGVLNKYERSILNYPSSVEVVAFDNLNAMQMALQSGQIDAMIHQRRIQLLHEEALAAHLVQRPVQYHVAGGLHGVKLHRDLRAV